MTDVLLLARPTPLDDRRRALFGWLTEKGVHHVPCTVVCGVMLVSDNQSWIYHNHPYAAGQQGASDVLTEWQRFVQRQRYSRGDDNCSPRLVCIDLQPYGTTQALDRADILNIGDFSTAVFQVVAAFLSADESRFVAAVEVVEL